MARKFTKVSFFRLLPFKKLLFIISDPAFTKTKKVLKHLKTRPEENRQHCRHSLLQTNEQMKKLFDSDELGPAESNNQLAQLVLPRSLFWSRRATESTPANTNNSIPARKTTKELTILSLVLYHPRKLIRVVQEILQMNATLRQVLFPALKLASNQLHTSSILKYQGSRRNNSGTTSVSHGDQSFPQYFYNYNVQLDNQYSSR